MAPGADAVRSSELRVAVSFRVRATDGAARAGVLTTRHGEIRTPAFMPVGTKATVKSLHPDEVRALGARRRPRATRTTCTSAPARTSSSSSAGSTPSRGWDGPILTDSGGFQVFSLRDTIAALDEDGVTLPLRLRRVRGALHARRRRRDPAPARLGHRDVPRRLPARRASRARSSSGPSRDHDRAGPSARSTHRARRASFASGSRRAARTRAADAARSRRSRRLPFDGYALGGLAVGESKEEMLDCVEWAAPLLPGRAARATSWASATRRGSSRSSRAAIDMFDCVLPTRTARTGSALTWEGRLNLRNAAYRTRPAPARPGVRLPARASGSRARTSATSSRSGRCSDFGC